MPFRDITPRRLTPAQSIIARARVRPNRTTTRTSREARLLESQLLIDLNTILLFIKDNYDFTSFNYGQQLADIKNLAYNRVYEIMRSYYQRAYTMGSAYANRFLSLEPFTTHSDLDFIDASANEFTQRFFGRIENTLAASADLFVKSLFSTNDSSVNPMLSVATNNPADEGQIQFFSKRIEKTRSYLFSSLAILVVTDGLHNGTVRKTKALLKLRSFTREDLNRRKRASNVFTGAASASAATIRKNKRLYDDLLLDLETETNPDSLIDFLEESGATDEEIANISVNFVWKTAEDEKVCPICEELDGSVYAADDPNIPQVETDTHFNCRCAIELE